MIMLKKIVLATIFVTISLSAMDEPKPKKIKHSCSDICIKTAHDRVDARVLFIPKDAWFKSVRGTWASAWEYAQCTGDESQIKERLAEINEVIPRCCRNDNMFTTLQKNHWYVSYIVTDMVGRRVEQFKNVTGSQVSSLLSYNTLIDEGFSPQMNQWIQFQAKKQYMQGLGYSDDLMKIPCGRANEDIHHLKLYGEGINLIQKIDIVRTEEEEDYILGITEGDHLMIWSVKDGSTREKLSSYAKLSACSMNECVNTDLHLIILGIVRSVCTDEIIRKLYSQDGYQGIVIFARPTFESYICQQAFKNSQHNKKELEKLQEFAKITALLKGFVKNNLWAITSAQLLESNRSVKEVY